MEALRKRFISPEAEFSPVPFWFLNGDLTQRELRRQIRDFKAHGVYGVVLHPRMGLDARIGYLSKEFIDLIAFAVEAAREEGMFVVLYDEGMYPSGSASGQVVRENAAYASRGIRIYREEEQPLTGRVVARVAVKGFTGSAYKGESARLLFAGERVREGETALLVTEDFSHGTIRGIHAGEDDGEENAPPSADLLNADAVRCFIRLTHERYYAALAPEFARTIRAIFTDEPNPLGRNTAGDMRAWTGGLDKEWVAAGQSLCHLPALFYDAGEGTPDIRAAYERLIDDRLALTYYGQLKDWCDTHGIALAGHPAKADSIGLERYFTIPGQDMVWRFVAPGESALTGPESTQAKCAADSARHALKRRNASECFGCCGPRESQWGMTVADIKWMLDYLFVRGTNLIFPHAFFYAIDTPLRYGDRPPDVGPNNYWWPYFQQIADYIARMCMFNTDGVNQARVAVLTSGKRLPWRLPAALFRRQVEFNYLEIDDLLRARIEAGCVHIAAQRYNAVAVEDPTLLKPEVRMKLDALIACGGVVTAMGEGGRQSVSDIAQELEGMFSAAVQLTPPGADIRAAHILHGQTHVFILTNEGEEIYKGEVSLGVAGACERWDAWTGETRSLGTRTKGLALVLPARASLIYIVDENAQPRPEAPEEDKLTAQVLDLSECFALQLPDGTIKNLPALRNWQELPEISTFNGTLCYEADFVLERIPARAVINLGTVREMATVRVNESPARALLIPPFEMDAAEFIHEGVNHLSVAVTSCRATHFDGVPWVCGLLGPVKIRWRPA